MSRDTRTDMAQFDDTIEREFRWPRRGDKPFLPSDDWQRNARLEEHVSSRLVMMITGYKQAWPAYRVTSTDVTGTSIALCRPRNSGDPGRGRSSNLTQRGSSTTTGIRRFVRDW